MDESLTRIDRYLFDLPEELIAQHPCDRRDHSRLLVVDRSSQIFFSVNFYDLPQLLEEGDGLIFNNTKVIPALLKGKKSTGASCEVLLVEEKGPWVWEVMVRPGRKLKGGSRIVFGGDFCCEVLDVLSSGHRVVRFEGNGDFWGLLEKWGEMPLPQYIRRGEIEEDKERYQTVYAEVPGAVAAPTAGLHFTEDLLRTVKGRGVLTHMVTLHVGPGTFRPVQVDDIRHHKMHPERYFVPSEVADALGEDCSGLRVAVGTTALRTLEGAWRGNSLKAGWGETDLFVYPGYDFRCVRSLLTNFHLPGSTLFMLVCAFAGYDLAHEAYQFAVKEKFRFFSYGDAMLIL